MERYKKIYALPKPLLAEGAPVCILRGVLLFDSECECFVAQLKLKNLSDREIGAVRVRITEKNGNGINYRERIAYTYDAVAAVPEASFGGRTDIPMAHKGIRSFDVTVCEVLFTDGEKWVGKDAVFAPAAQTPLRDVLPRDAQIAWRARYGKRAVYECAESDALWLCTCGTPNGKESATCSECGARRLALLTPDVAALTAEGYTRRTVALIAKGNENAFAEAEALIAAAPEGVDAADLAHKLEAGRLALAEKQARRRRGVKIALGISIPAAVLAIAITLLSILVLVPFGHYNKGVELAKSNQYYDAYCELREANGFNDAEVWIETVTHNMKEEARRLLREGEVYTALNLIRPFIDVEFNNAEEWVAHILKDKLEDLLNKGDFASALNIVSLSMDTEFSDVEEWVTPVLIEKAKILLSESNPIAARTLITLFKDAGFDIIEGLTATEKDQLYGDGSSFSKAKWMHLGSTTFSGSSAYYYAFTPRTSGSYTFYSTSYGDMNATLFDDEHSYIIGDTRAGNFNITYYLTAGSTYYLVVSTYRFSVDSATIHVEMN